MIDIIIPVSNEANNILPLMKRLDKALHGNKKRISYTAIFIIDPSTDDTLGIIKKAAEEYPIKFYEKVGKPGKGYSLLEGFSYTTQPYIAMIDGDLQYPPEALPQMIKVLKKDTVTGIVVANRKKTHKNKIRAHGSKLARLIVGKMLFGYECDVQSGLKVFRKEIAKSIDAKKVGKWTLDLQLLHIAEHLGYKTASVPIKFASRAYGQSKVSFFVTAVEILTHAITLKLTKPVYRIPSSHQNGRGAGVAYNRKQFITHSLLDLRLSALRTFSAHQGILILLTIPIVIYYAFLNITGTLIVLMGVITVMYFSDFIVNLFFIMRHLHTSPEISFSDEEVQNMDDTKLPLYTILCPLYKEAGVIPQFTQAMNSLLWPKDKLEVLFLLEEDDLATIGAMKQMNLPEHFKMVIVPHSLPKTKPKACNYGLAIAKGKYTVIYDAEDVPEPTQLKKAYLAFKNLPQKVACVQAKLNFYNKNYNILTRLFTAEYSLWFDVVLPGMQTLDTNIPLGGTSNHFKTQALRDMHGWDAFNVAEDCDLGARLFKKGFRTAILDSVTKEEATSVSKSWIRQRSRWIKGYMQTYLVHMRRPLDFLRNHGLGHVLLFQLSIGGKPLTMLINPILWVITISYFSLYAYVGEAIESIFPSVIFYMAVLSLIFGNFLAVYYYMIGCAKREQWSLIKFVFLVPLYWILLSIASYMALWQLIFKPHFWEKTTHGAHLAQGIVTSPQPSVIVETVPSQNKEKIIHGLSAGLASMLRRKKVADPNKLDILFFNWRDTKHIWAGGAEVYVHNLAKRLVNLGHNVTLFCGNDRHSKNHEVIEGVTVIRRGGFVTVYLFAAFYYLTSFRKKYDLIIESANGIPFFTPLFSTIPKLLIVHHVHQEVFMRYLPRVIAWFPRLLEAHVVPLVYRHSRIMTISKSTKDQLVQLWGVAEDDVKVINPGVDIVPEVLMYPKTVHPSFLYLGRLKAYKNIDVIIKAFKRIYAEYPKARMAIAGEGEEDHNLIRLIKKHGLTEAVTMLGKVKEHDKYLLYSETWAALQPSTTEGWGITVIEANAAGTPVIARDTAGLRDSVVNNETGLLVSDVDDFTKAMKLIISDTKFRTELSVNARSWSDRFSWDAAASSLDGVIKSMLSDSISNPGMISYEMSVDI